MKTDKIYYNHRLAQNDIDINKKIQQESDDYEPL